MTLTTIGWIEAGRGHGQNLRMLQRACLAAPRAGLVTTVFLFSFILVGCRTATQPRALSFAEQVAAAHGVEDWEVEQALRGELLARFEAGDVVDLRFVIEIGGPRVR